RHRRPLVVLGLRAEPHRAAGRGRGARRGDAPGAPRRGRGRRPPPRRAAGRARAPLRRARRRRRTAVSRRRAPWLVLALVLATGCVTATVEQRRTRPLARVGDGERIAVLGRRAAAEYQTERDFVGCIREAL